MLKLSIIVPIYNVEAYVDRCFYSLCNQNLDKECYEIIAVNDGTPDSSMQIVEKYACAYPNVCIVNQINQGVSVARNNGIRKSTGNYLLFVDPDDWIAPDSLKSIYDYLLSHSDIEVLFLKSICSSNNKERYKWSDKVEVDAIYTGEDLCKYNYIRGSVWGGVYEKDFLLYSNISFPKNIINGEDSIFILLIMMLATKIAFLDLPFYYVYEREGSASRIFTVEKAYKFKENIKYLLSLRKNDLQKYQSYLINLALYSVISVSVNYFVKSGFSNYNLLYDKLNLSEILPIKVVTDYSNLRWKVFLLNNSFRFFCFLKKVKI